MAIQPIQPPRRDPLGKALTIGGAVAGGVLTGGSPAGIATGAGLGQTAGGLLAQQQPQSVESQGMARRQQTLGQDPLLAIAQADAELQKLPQDQFPETRRAFQEAMLIARRNQQLGGRTV